ncbi:hypothetical protein KKF61_01720 [Patescibacteria group bacterium]|nr:hypothetical protein [Patescibacteria group bacterium]MBU0964502.1 hypothetical protein [Patescibacteria group bacterium]
MIEQPPAKTMQLMQRVMANMNTAHYDLQGEVVWLTDEDPFVLRNKISFDGGIKEQLLGNLAMQNEIQIHNLNFLANGEIRATEDKTYFRITEVPAIPYFKLEEVKDKWYSFSSLAILEPWWESATMIKEAMRTSSFFALVERKPDEIFNNQLTYHYSVKADQENLKDLMASLSESVTKQNDYDLSLLSNLNIDLWIGKSEKNLNRLELQLESNNLIVSYTVNVTGFNKTVTIDEPGLSYVMDNFSQDLFKKSDFIDLPLYAYLSGIRIEPLIADKDNDGLYLMWENVFGTDPNKADTDGDGFDDGPEVINGYNPLGNGKIFRSL